MLMLMTFRNRGVYGSQRLGKSRLFSVLTGQKSVRWSIDELTDKGYMEVNKALDKPFVLNWWALDCLFMPPKYLDDLKKADFKSLSFFQSLSDAFHLRSSVGDLYNTTTMIDVVKRRLNPQLPTLVPYLVDECNFAFPADLGEAKDWKSYKAFELCSSLMHRVTSRILIGEELCRDPRYIESSLRFSESVFMNGVILSSIPLGPFRAIASYIGSFKHRQNMQKVMSLVTPVIEKRLQDLEQNPGDPSPNDAVQWTIELASPGKLERTPHRLAHQVLQNLWAGSGAPGGMLTQMIYQVLMYPELLEPMRDEIRKAVDEHGWTDKMLNSIPHVDSFLRETNRLYPNGVITAARTVMEKPFQFHDGLTLPKGTRIAFPARAIMCDSDNFESPYEFDGFRFARLLAAKDETEKSGEQLHHSATVSKTNLAFGFGKHACVGRFYAVRKVKVVFSRLILDYEIKWANDVKQRPANLCIEGQNVPNPEQKIMIKQRVK
ncbi:cytochrome P450 [Phaeosphaeriaceae sp. PMI808]|nr:cytochrome P450 [Phaeosphaeriaceae sp. PMI808]